MVEGVAGVREVGGGRSGRWEGSGRCIEFENEGDSLLVLVDMRIVMIASHSRHRLSCLL